MVSLDTTGGMKQFANFLDELNKVPNLIHIEKLELSPETRRSGILRGAITIYKTFIP